ncbi:DUF116 domain-containing protein [Halanaerobacter jeridensis]|uniref:DUF116 domain-containing protein n=1 Tax=Halanaerobacter jeridensis TaxID=706427 RepID=A0A938XRA0_9FIRM|nr:DUF116 domain-containing protein [Halanaerobacter jeridensis]MBM7558162.1 hypothetical protein [Halanaerobacter jeridensis]
MRESKKTFINLLILSFLFITIIVIALWSNFFGFDILTDGIIMILGILLTVIDIILILGVIGILLITQRGEPISGLIFFTKLVISYFLPIIIKLGSYFGFNKDEILLSFIKTNNQLINPGEIEVKPEKILLFTPHCIQWSECIYRVTADCDNCQQCGQCQIQDLIELSEKYGIQLEIVTGGTVARKQVKQLKPEAIIGIACERDLSSAIQDVYPLPVFGVINLRPHGPCFNTKVNIEEVEKALEKLLS